MNTSTISLTDCLWGLGSFVGLGGCYALYRNSAGVLHRWANQRQLRLWAERDYYFAELEMASRWLVPSKHYIGIHRAKVVSLSNNLREVRFRIGPASRAAYTLRPQISGMRIRQTDSGMPGEDFISYFVDVGETIRKGKTIDISTFVEAKARDGMSLPSHVAFRNSGRFVEKLLLRTAFSGAAPSKIYCVTQDSDERTQHSEEAPLDIIANECRFSAVLPNRHYAYRLQWGEESPKAQSSTDPLSSSSQRRVAESLAGA